MKRLSIALGSLLVIVAVGLFATTTEATTARWKGPPGSAPGCGNTNGNPAVCDVFVCVTGGSGLCTSSYTVGGTPGGGQVALCICTDSEPGC